MDLISSPLGIVILTFLSIFCLFVGFGYLWDFIHSRYYVIAERWYKIKFVNELQYEDNFPKVLGKYVAIVLGLCVLAYFINPWFIPMVIILAVAYVPMTHKSKKDKRLKKIDAVLPSVLQQLAANTKNTSSISLALEEVARTAPKPMDYELTLISRQEKELKSFTKAINSARDRLNSKWFDIVSSVLITADEKGGKTSDALENLADVFIQLTAMQNRIDTATSQGRMSMKVMLVLPFFVIFLVAMVDPGMLSLVWNSGAGIVMLCLASFFYLVSLALAIWLSKVKI